MTNTRTINNYIKILSSNYPDEYIIVSKPVNPKHEITAILAKLESLGKTPAVLFEKVGQSKIPVLTNVFSSRKRIALALDTTEDLLNIKIRNISKNIFGSIEVDSAPVQEVCFEDKLNIFNLPIITHNEKDAGPYITGGISVLKDPDTGNRNLGIYRHLLLGPDSIGVKFAETSHANYIHEKYANKNLPMPIAIFIGHHPSWYLSAVDLNDDGIDEYDVASSYIGEKVSLVKCKKVDLEIPSDAEIVLEGEILPDKIIKDGPIGEYTKVYGKEVNALSVDIKAITMKNNPVYLDVNSGHLDHQMLGGISRLGNIFNAVKKSCPTVQDIYMPPSGCCRFSCYVSIKKRHEGEAKNALAAAIGADPFIKLAIAVDDDINIYNDSEILSAVNTRWRPKNNTFFIDNAKTNFLDPTVDSNNLVTKICIDATQPLGNYQETISVPSINSIKIDDYL